MKKLLFIWILCLNHFVFAQDGQFSQYFTTTTLVNPAYAGIRPEMEFSTNYKKSGSLDNDNFFELAQATFIAPLKVTTSSTHQIGGVGATFFRERRGFQGIYTSQKVLLTGAYSIRLSQFIKNYVVFGLQAGIVQNRLSEEVLNWGSQFNRFYGYDDSLQGETIATGAFYYPTVNFGVLYTVFDNQNIYIRDKSLIVGFSAENLNKPRTGDNSNTRKNILYKGFGSMKLRFAPRFYVHPSVLTLLDQSNLQFNVGCYLSTMVNSVRSRTSVLLQVGSWYRQGDSFIVLGGFQVQHFKVGASFDLNSESFSENVVFSRSNPSYEISLTYIITRSKNVRKVSNPIF